MLVPVVQDVEGEVVAWDQEKKVMILKTESATRSNLNNVEIINTAFITDFEVLFFYLITAMQYL